jgi:hypothetical protein
MPFSNVLSLSHDSTLSVARDDADSEMAVKGAIASKYRNAGQSCVCANRILADIRQIPGGFGQGSRLWPA